ncbi:MAG: tRNA (adenosine(37)-N6)-threonylcarbamoyltransferase complex ATPase subunit type 1 TsaE [Salinisphaera sp.]|jgi:tRNA threonylcarbamoyladenosine biosynthesis protein TsaE|nr:tRNA (adenosine(37)-N6)-threonylcarbamoyltransferase complex ATPase subunit type 1 TsaE [Salinisphaera sp.]
MIHLPDAAATDALGRAIALALTRLQDGLVLSLRGEVGAGKTALTRAVLRALGHTGPVVSPTYTLMEAYALVPAAMLVHMDLYRLIDPEELEFIGIRDVDASRDWVFIEWAERGAGFLPPIDAELTLEYRDTGRLARIQARNERGERWAGLAQESR